MTSVCNADNVLSLKDMDPDFNEDGVVSPLEKEVYDRMMAADVNDDGYLTRSEVYTVIARMKGQIDEASKGGIPITALNPDFQGDGKIENWEKDVYGRIQQADEDKSGVISVKELFGVIKKAAESDKQKLLFQRLLGVAMLVILVLVGAMFGMSIVAGEAIKESHVNGDGVMTTLSGAPLTVSQTVSTDSLYELPALNMQQMSHIESLKFYVDMSSAVGSTYEPQMAVRFSSAYTPDNDVAVLMTPEAHTITIQRAAKTATIKMGTGPYAGSTFSLTEEPTTSSARKLRMNAETKKPENRRMARRGAYLSSSGSFELSAGGGDNYNIAGN